MSSFSSTMPPRRRPRAVTSTNANEGDEVRGLADSIGYMLMGVLDRVQHPRSMKKKDVFDADAVEFKGAKRPLDAYSEVDKMERAFESTELPEEKKTFSFGQQQYSGCFECGGQDHFRRECPLSVQRTTSAPTQPVGQSSARGSSGGSQGGSATRGGSQQGSGQRGHPMTRARLHPMTQHEGRSSPDVIIDTLLIFCQPALTLIDLGATHSFMSCRFALHTDVPLGL
ncbi:hypothetical protein ACLB2K_017659 [Fragaria x ananassa]